jgi:hypothetical protein
MQLVNGGFIGGGDNKGMTKMSKEIGKTMPKSNAM